MSFVLFALFTFASIIFCGLVVYVIHICKDNQNQIHINPELTVIPDI